ncbi:MAG TPA: nuclear transport factor 2 family protein [Edaphobacter sp.]
MRLRSTVLAASLSLSLFASTLRAQGPQQLGTVSQQQLDVIKVLLAQENAWNNGDLQTFAEAYKQAPDILFITNSISRGYDGLAESYKRDYPTRASMGTLGFSEIEVKPLDERFAVVIGRYRLERGKKEGGNATGYFSLVMEKTDKGWKIIVDHTTG